MCLRICRAIHTAGQIAIHGAGESAAFVYIKTGSPRATVFELILMCCLAGLSRRASARATFAGLAMFLGFLGVVGELHYEEGVLSSLIRVIALRESALIGGCQSG
ncbi:hypothetical protein [Pseudomonas sp. Q1-7]|uniref:hypothetical protein n=1 Tax=Pseudomonas sp. Q1-7 TaxID=3020843 RepID=UPI002301F0D6|nr:hypothetical protein [Pseudomonas sp. Q1-7]